MNTLTIANAGLSGFFAFAAIHYAVAWSLSRREAALLVFSVQCGLYAVFSLAISAFFHATTIPGSQAAMNRFYSIGITIHAVILESYARLGHRRDRTYRLGVSGTLIGIAVLNQWVPVRGTVLELRAMQLPWGGGTGLLPIRTPPGLLLLLGYLATAAVQAYGFFIARTIWKRDRTGALLVAAGAVMVLAGSALGFLIDFAKVRAPYAGASPHAFYVLCMALYLSREYAARGASLAASERRAEKSLQEARETMAHLQAEQGRREEAEAARIRTMEALVQAQRKELASQLAAGVAHDYNNVLASISLWSGLLLKDDVSPALRESARGALDSARKHGEGLTRQLMALARPEARCLKRFPLDGPVQTTVQTLTPALPRGIELRFEPTGAPEVEADETEIQQVLYNLVLNARDALPGGGIIEVTAGLVASPVPIAVAGGSLAAGRWAMLSVADSGTGVDPAIRERIFDLFFSTKDRSHGTGVGLTTAVRIAKAHGGGIALESAVGGGATFKVYLPCA